MIIADCGDLIARRLREQHRALAARWFERLLDLLPVNARDVFPTENLLDHIPSLILEISEYLRRPMDAAVVSNTAILEKARELGALRHAQRASLHQVLREYQILSAILVSFVVEELEGLGLSPSPADTASIVSRLHEAVSVLSQATVESFVGLYTETIAEQTQRLEQFTRMAAHEWRQPLGALQFGVSLLTQASLDPPRKQRTLEALQRNVSHLIELTHKLESVARVRQSDDSPVVQEVDASTVIAEAARQLREMADARGVDIRIADGLPRVTVDVGRLELTFVNLISNAIKYSDPAKPTRYVEITGGEDPQRRCRIIVRDNGIGIAEDALPSIFHRFTRAHERRTDVRHVGGIGLGLSIVEDCMHALGGTIEVESAEGAGTTFVLTLPIQPLRAEPLKSAE
jgi:signal transduction histidine kinase